MTCSVCGSEPDGRFCVECCNDARHPVDPTLDAVVLLRRGFAAVNAKDYVGAVNEFRDASHLAPTLPPGMAVMMWFILSSYICKASAGSSISKMPTPALIEYIQALETGQRLVPRLPLDLLELKEKFSSWFPQFLGWGYEALEARGESRAAHPRRQGRVGEANSDNYMFAYPTGAERLNAGATGIRCVRCPNHVIPVPPCQNCGNGIYLFGVDVFNATGLFCLACRRDFTFLTCVCGCQNPIQADTIMRLKGT